MSGFSINLKGSKVSKAGSGKGKSTLLAKAASSKGKAAPLRKNILSAEEEEDDHKKTTIDGFDSAKGALSGTKAVAEKEKLVITPTNLSVKLLRPSRPEGQQERSSHDPEDSDAKARMSLLSGESVEDSSSLAISMAHTHDAEESTEKDYENVPVEQFGMALLRGMGWDGKATRTTVGSDVRHRQKGVTLGIGATAVDKEIEEELMGVKGAKLTVPMLQKGRD